MNDELNREALAKIIATALAEWRDFGPWRSGDTDSNAHHAADLVLAALPIPVTGEVEWGVRQERDGEVFEFSRERHARDYAEDVTTVTHHGGNVTEHSRTLVRRTVGPWIEVTP